jgi:cell division protein FtsW (lipid II flippase)
MTKALDLDYFRALFAFRRRAQRDPRAAPPLGRTLAKSAMLAAIAAVCFWWQASHALLLHASEKIRLREFTVTIPAGGAAVIGYRDLGQRQGATAAEEKHIRLENKDGLWLRNVAAARRLYLEYPSFDGYAEYYELRPRQVSRIAVPGATLVFDQVTSDQFNLTVDSAGVLRRFHYDQAQAQSGLARTDGTRWNDTCARLRGVAWLTYQFRKLAAGSFLASQFQRSETVIATLGGSLDCVEAERRQIGAVGQLEWHSLKIIRWKDRFFLAPFEAARRNEQLIVFSSTPDGRGGSAKALRQTGFSGIGWPIEGGPDGPLTSLIAGRTKYRISTEHLPNGAVRVAMRPIESIALFSADDCKTDEARKLCPRPLDQARPTECKRTDPQCWVWTPPSSELATGSGGGAVVGEATIIKRQERWLRVTMVALAVVLVIVLNGGPLRGSKYAWSLPSWRMRWTYRMGKSLRPLLLTLLSCSLALAPELLGYLGVPLDSIWALRLTILNWLLAAAVLGASGLALMWFWLAVTCLAAVGAVNLAAMAVDGDSTRWVEYFVRHKYLFLDLVPPVVIAVASCEVAGLQRALQIFVNNGDWRGTAFRLLAALSLIAVFGLWLLIGKQTGLGPFQPVEAGKFAMIFLAATVLTFWYGRLRTGKISRTLLTSIPAALMIVVFVLVLIVVPYLRSDYSPILIMASLLMGLTTAFGAIIWLMFVRKTMDEHVARQQIPVVFKPPLRGRWYLRRAILPIGAPLALAVVGLVWLMAGTPVGKMISLTTGMDAWPGAMAERLSFLETKGLGSGRRVVVERFLTWVDLDYDRATVPDCRFDGGGTSNALAANAEPMRACYRDIELQIIRSRRTVARAPCDTAADVTALTSPVDNVGTTVRGLLELAGSPLRLLTEVGPTCRSEHEGSTAGPNEELRPIKIPVVESDFAAAYLLSRFGIELAVLLYAAQSLLIVVAAVAFGRITWSGNSGATDRALRNFLGVLVIGAALLHGLQWVLAWSNVFGLLPVMGQPMTWLSYATSHHLFAALPSLLVFVVALRYARATPYRYSPRMVPDIERSIGTPRD